MYSCVGFLFSKRFLDTRCLCIELLEVFGVNGRIKSFLSQGKLDLLGSRRVFNPQFHVKEKLVKWWEMASQMTD